MYLRNRYVLLPAKAGVSALRYASYTSDRCFLSQWTLRAWRCCHAVFVFVCCDLGINQPVCNRGSIVFENF